MAQEAELPFSMRDPSNLKKVATIDVSGWNTQMHLVDDQLILVSSDWQATMLNGATGVQVFDVTDPSTPKLQTSLKVAGSSQQSRFAAGQLTLYGSSYVRALRPLFITETPNTVYTELTETPIGRFETAEEFAAHPAAGRRLDAARCDGRRIGSQLEHRRLEGSDCK